MEDNNHIIEHENTRMREALKTISEHQAAINKALEDIADLLKTDERADNTPVTDEDVKSLLKKYSRLS